MAASPDYNRGPTFSEFDANDRPDIHGVIETDCRSRDGITIGLIDAITSIARVLAHRDLRGDVVEQALEDLVCDEDLRSVLQLAGRNLMNKNDLPKPA